MTRIFLSYRREDSGVAGRLADQLEKYLGAGSVFRDVDETPGGAKWLEYLKSEISEATAFVLVIGQGWTQRIDDLKDPEDVLRQEIELALRRDGLLFIPILFDNKNLPSVSELPATIRSIPEFQAVSVSDPMFVETVRTRVIPALGIKRKINWRFPFLIGAVGAVVLVGLMFYEVPPDPPPPKALLPSDAKPARSCDSRVTGLPGSLHGFNEIGLVDSFTSVTLRGTDMRIGFTVREDADVEYFSCLKFLFCEPQSPNFCKTITTAYRPIKGRKNIFSFRVGDNWPVGNARVHMKLVRVSDLSDLATSADTPLSLADYTLFGEARDFTVK